MKERKKVQVWIHRKINGAREVLILKMREDRGGFWQPVTGSVEKGEKVETAALREAFEETSLPFFSPPKALDHSFQFESRGHRFTEFCFEVEASPEAEVRLDPHEHTEFRWVKPDEALAQIHHPSNAEALELLLRRWSRDN